MKWIENYRVSAQDTDLNRIASASALMRFMQDTANYHMEGMGPSYDELFDSGRAFILSRFAMVCHAPLFSHDPIAAETWAAPSRGAAFNRCYRILRKDEVVAEAVSVWALVDTKSGALLRVEECGIDYGEDLPLEITEPLRFRIPADAGMVPAGLHEVRYSDADVNRHMNNTKYPDVLSAFLPMEGKRIRSLALSFVSEAPLGQSVSVELGTCSDAYYFRTLRQDGKVNVEARIVLGGI